MNSTYICKHWKPKSIKGQKERTALNTLNYLTKSNTWEKRGQDKTNPIVYKQLLKEMITTPSRRHDDFIIGVEGSRQIAEKVLSKVKDFVEDLNLRLNDTKRELFT
jgi:hypothetical protein